MKRLLLCTAILALPCIAFANPVPDTGQTKCYDAGGIEIIPCPQPGEPFYGQDAQFPCNPQSYTKLDANGNDLPDDAPWPWAMVRDNVTGLIWEVKTYYDYGSIHNQNDTYNWYDAQSVFIVALNNANFGGFSDWRLPTIKELVFILDRDKNYPLFNATYFPTLIDSYYWSSTAHPGWADKSWVCHMGNGYTTSLDRGERIFVLAVRGVQSANNFVDNGDGTVTDISTGLMWQQGTAPSVYTWQQALDYCENLILAEHNDWRFPNANELHSIVDYYSNDLGFATWSSTTDTSTPQSAWVIFFSPGGVLSNNKSLTYKVRAVRAGQCVSFDDEDNDGFFDRLDNCPSTPNGPDGGTCTKGTIVQACTGNGDCGTGGVCSMKQEDADRDYQGDACDYCTDTDKDGYGNPGFSLNTCLYDNCPSTANGPALGTCTAGVSIGETCADYRDCSFSGLCRFFVCITPGPTYGNSCWEPGDCSIIGFCDNNQLDSYPPQSNSIGDACDCEGNFNCSEDQDVDGTDAALLKADFGRGGFKSPCIAGNPCNGDFSCDGDVDGTDAALFKQDFGRSQFSNPCPTCTQSTPWCQYP